MITLGLVALAGAALILRSWVNSSPSLARSPFQHPKFSRLTTSGNNLPAVISPDGKYVAYAVTENGKQSLWLRVIANSSDLRIMPPEDVIYAGLSISPDSQMMY
jgi:Tol biopolymer transport system component